MSASELKGIQVLEKKLRPDRFGSLWDSIHVGADIKDALLCQALLNFTFRPRVATEAVPLHGIILLVGPSGTGKTSLAKGLASKLADLLHRHLTYIEVEPHALTSSAMGRSQKAVTELFNVIAEHAVHGPTYVLLDEVETIAADRAKLSLEANPIDVHRATDAALVQLDFLSANHKNILVVATSNFATVIDRAFVSRTDLLLSIPMPDAAACKSILEHALQGVAKAFPDVAALLKDQSLASIAKQCVGLEGRQIRKAVAAACTFDRRVAADPNLLTVEHLRLAITRLHSETRNDGHR